MSTSYYCLTVMNSSFNAGKKFLDCEEIDAHYYREILIKKINSLNEVEDYAKFGFGPKDKEVAKIYHIGKIPKNRVEKAIIELIHNQAIVALSGDIKAMINVNKNLIWRSALNVKLFDNYNFIYTL